MNNQERILMSLVQGQEGKAWALDKNGWKDDHETFVCLWDYIECDSYKTTVIGINMVEADFVGTLSPQLGNLLTLQEISMRRNLIVGKIPQEIANLPHLEKVFLAENRLTGTIPNFASYNLKTLDLKNNLLTGSLSPMFALNNHQLTELDLSSNMLTGTLPKFLPESQYYKLISVSLSDNQLSGTIHSIFGSLSTLTYLYLDGNNLMGTIPSEFSGSSSPLQRLWLQNNQLTGTIPPAIGEMKDLFNFYVDGNKLTGEVPSSLCRPEINADFFEDVIEDSPDRDYCESIACPAGKVSFEGVYPCNDCNDRFFNPYLGRVKECINLEEMDILRIFYEATGGYKWIKMENPWNMQGTTYCDFEGIECGNHGNIIAIDLKGKGLRGTIPGEIGYLRYLEQLDLSNNYLEGILPSDLRWAPLRFLDVSNNRIKGIIPHTLCSKEGINGNGHDGEFDCDLVQCSAGFYSRIGRATERKPCNRCFSGEDTPFIGSTECHKLFHVPWHLRGYIESHRVVVPIFLFVVFISIVYVGCFALLDNSIIRLDAGDDEDDEEEKLTSRTSEAEKDAGDKKFKRYKDSEDDDSNSSDEENQQLSTQNDKTNEKNMVEMNLISLDDEDEQTVTHNNKSLINFEEESEIVDKQPKDDDGESISGNSKAKLDYKKLDEGAAVLT